MMAAEMKLQTLIANIRDGLRAQPKTPDCPDEEEWLRIAAGLTPAAQADPLIHHAAECGHCGRLLREAVEDLAEPDEQAAAEIDAIVTPEWRQKMVQRLTESPGATETPGPTASRRGWLEWLRLPVWVYPVAAMAVVVVVGGFFAWPAWRLHQVNELTLEAYAEKRQIDFQLPGAPYAPIRRERGAGEEPPWALAEAESIAASGLESHPESPIWLAARGRIDLLKGDYPRAIETLEQALTREPDSTAIQVDLAAAYYQAAQGIGNPEDFRKAYDLLNKVLAKAPDNATALYDRALTAESLKLRDEAAKDWNHYLQRDATSAWAGEARRRLQPPR
jgi:cytochrome c-type biogenesis protein CcmH/NrfG